MIARVVLTAALAAGLFSSLAILWVLAEWWRCPQHKSVPPDAFWLSLLFGLSWALVYALGVAA